MPPILLIEILADLEKGPDKGRMPEKDVACLSGKLLDIDSKSSVLYQALRNWQARRFNDAENILAEEWSRATAAIDLESFRRSYAKCLRGKTPPRRLDEGVP